jgi:hypothetical protein
MLLIAPRSSFRDRLQHTAPAAAPAAAPGSGPANPQPPASKASQHWPCDPALPEACSDADAPSLRGLVRSGVLLVLALGLAFTLFNPGPVARTLRSTTTSVTTRGGNLLAGAVHTTAGWIVRGSIPRSNP